MWTSASSLGGLDQHLLDRADDDVNRGAGLEFFLQGGDVLASLLSLDRAD